MGGRAGSDGKQSGEPPVDHTWQGPEPQPGAQMVERDGLLRLELYDSCLTESAGSGE
jgi:hypothetical protein